ncbi:MAG: glucose-1-phosphate adenylyltransferase [Clostridia bacterium]|nr:glucose-1-phosphate adenylyltransferase [Clostridia bacterium]MBR3272609.1 glucose-1-phosphate adenylyltransferase [Clostridia bacterium]
MKKKKCIAMLLAGGQGSRLGLLTKVMAKPAVPFGGKYRIIDFPLSNCTNSNIDTVGVLTQYRPLELNSYIGSGQTWDLDLSYGGVYVLPPYATADSSEWYKGTANAIYQNFGFIEQFDPEYVLVLSGDHIYKMDYNRMLNSHIERNADVTIAVRPVPWEVAPSFGIMNVDDNDAIIEFEEKPKQPKSNLASMGVYIFTWKIMKEYLTADAADPKSQNDFGKNIIPNLLNDKKALYAYAFTDYWKDVGTISSLWEANMDLLKSPPEFDLTDPRWKIYSRTPVMPPHFIADDAVVANSMITEGCEIDGAVRDSVLFAGVTVEKGAVVEDSVIMPGTTVKAGAVVRRAIVSENCVIAGGCQVGEAEGDIALIGQDTVLPEGYVVKAGLQVDTDAISRKEGA